MHDSKVLVSNNFVRNFSVIDTEISILKKMTSTELSIFLSLFQKVHFKCFGTELNKPLTETECKHLSNEIFEETGLILGWKSIKNYSQFLLNIDGQKQVNPTIASLDTLVRYVENASKTNETIRKKEESHFPYWFDFKEAYLKETPVKNSPNKFQFRKTHLLTSGFLLLILGISILYEPKQNNVLEEFEKLDMPTLQKSGWQVLNIQSDFWQKRNQTPHHLTLFTLKGDNFDKGEKIKNLIIKKIEDEKFTVELHFIEFVPNQNWQQSGIILMEDSLFSNKNVRFSLNYNNFFGGTSQPAEIILQVVASLIDDSVKPEEIAQIPIFKVKSEKDTLVSNNLKKSALRIEKSGDNYRFLYAMGNSNFFAFKEISNRNLAINPKYIGIYASSGDSKNSGIIPVKIDKFIYKTTD